MSGRSLRDQVSHSLRKGTETPNESTCHYGAASVCQLCAQCPPSPGLFSPHSTQRGASLLCSLLRWVADAKRVKGSYCVHAVHEWWILAGTQVLLWARKVGWGHSVVQVQVSNGGRGLESREMWSMKRIRASCQNLGEPHAGSARNRKWILAYSCSEAWIPGCQVSWGETQAQSG